MNLLRIVLGAAALLPGVGVYLFFRPPGSAYFLDYFHIHSSLNVQCNFPFNYITNVLPDLIHPFSLILLSAGILTLSTQQNYILLVLFWVGIDIFFETLPVFKSQLLTILCLEFNNLPFL